MTINGLLSFQAYTPLLAWFYGVFGVELKPSSSVFGSSQSPEVETEIRAYLTGTQKNNM